MPLGFPIRVPLEIDSVHTANHLMRYVNLTQRLKYTDSCNLVTFFFELA